MIGNSPPASSSSGRCLPLAAALSWAILAAACLVLNACFLFGPRGEGEGQGDDGAIPSAFWGPWVRLDREQYLYFGDEKAYVRESRVAEWKALELVSASAEGVDLRDEGTISSAGELLRFRGDAGIPQALAVETSAGTIRFRKAAEKNASFKGRLFRDQSLAGGSGGRALVSAAGVSLVITNVLNSLDSQTLLSSDGGYFSVENTLPGDAYLVTVADTRVAVTVAAATRGEDVGTVAVPDRPQNFKVEYDFSPTPLEYGYYSAEFMVAGYRYQPMTPSGVGDYVDLYYDVKLRIRNTGAAAASNLSYALSPAAGLELRADSDALEGTIAGPLEPGQAQEIGLHLRHPASLDGSVDVTRDRIAVTVKDSEGYEWKDGAELAFWRRLVWIEVMRYHKEPMLGTIASPEGEASAAWIASDDAISWYYLPYRREGYTIGIYPASSSQGRTRYSVGFEKSVLAQVGLFEDLTSDGNEPNDSVASPTTLNLGQFILGMVGPGDADYFVTGPESEPPPADTTPPGKVGDLRATPGDRSLTMDWTEPGDADFAYVDVVGRNEEYPDYYSSHYAPKGTASCRVDELVNGSEYTFTVTSFDWNGNASEAAAVKALPEWTKGGATRYAESGTFGVLNLPVPLGKFDTPMDVALDAEGDYLVADAKNHRVQLLSPSGEGLYAWGRSDCLPSSALGGFNWPKALAVHGDSLYVADADNDRVQVFSISARAAVPVDYWGSSGTGQGKFNNPTGIECDGEHVYVSDTDNYRIQVFSLGGDFEKAWSGVFENSEKPYYKGPGGLFVFDGYLYAADCPHSRILRIPLDAASGDVSGVAETLSLDVGTSTYALAVPSDVRVTGDAIYVSESGFGRLFAFARSGSLLWYLEGQAGSPCGMAQDASGELVVADGGKHLIRRLDPANGAELSLFGGYAKYSGDGELRSPFDAELTPEGTTVYVSDSGNFRIQAFDAEGHFLRKWGRAGGSGLPGTGEGEFDRPGFLAVGPEGRVYVVDEGNNRVQAFGASGEFLAAIGDSAPASGTSLGSFDAPKGIAVSPGGGAVYIVDSANDRVQAFSTSTFGPIAWFWTDYVPGNEKPGYLYNAYALGADADGLLIANYGYNCRRIDPENGDPIRSSIIGDLEDVGEILDVEVDGDGNVYVALKRTTNEQSIRKYSPAGMPIAVISPSSAPFVRLAGIAVSPLAGVAHPGRVFAVDNYVNKVYFFDPAE